MLRNSQVKVAHVKVSSYEILHLAATPKLLVPGMRGWLIYPTAAIFRSIFVTTAYDIGLAPIQMFIFHRVVGGAGFSVGALITSPSGLLNFAGPGEAILANLNTSSIIAGATNMRSLYGADLLLTNDSGPLEFTLGDSDMIVDLAYVLLKELP